MILKSELNARNKIRAIGALSVPVVRYSFGIINWRIEEIKNRQENYKDANRVQHASSKSRYIQPVCNKERRRERSVTS